MAASSTPLCSGYGASPSPSQTTAATAAAAAVGLELELYCGVCSVPLPLSPPIFRCNLSHALCPPCHNLSPSPTLCLACLLAAGNHHRRSIPLPCPHAAHGCAATAPCHCPAGDFVGSISSLLTHLSTSHGWPTTNLAAAASAAFTTIHLKDGFNFLRLSSSSSRILMLAVTPVPPLGRAVSVICCIDGGGGEGKRIQCELELNVSRFVGGGGGGVCRRHYQSSRFDLCCSDLASGLPDPCHHYQMVVPEFVAGDDSDGGIRISIRIRIN
uniref:SIAH-type domain-containing protein n=1 Tax=Leersia perrieri TaxID=77586 RepID=A0A0D9WCY2_9ORYZ